MKKTQLNLSVLFFAIIILLGGCKKKDEEALPVFNGDQTYSFDSSLLKSTYKPGDIIEIPMHIVTNANYPLLGIRVDKFINDAPFDFTLEPKTAQLWIQDADEKYPEYQVQEYDRSLNLKEADFTFKYTVEDKPTGSYVAFVLSSSIGSPGGSGGQIGDPFQIKIEY